MACRLREEFFEHHLGTFNKVQDPLSHLLTDEGVRLHQPLPQVTLRHVDVLQPETDTHTHI